MPKTLLVNNEVPYTKISCVD